MPATAIKRHTELYEAVYGAPLKDEALQTFCKDIEDLYKFVDLVFAPQRLV